jgi:hypothetical protein
VSPHPANERRRLAQLGKPKPKRPYTENDKATALSLLKANNNNLLATTRGTGIPYSTLRKWKNGAGISRDVAPKCGAKAEELGSIFERVGRMYLENAMRPATVRRTRGRDSVIAACAAIDKCRLLRGESTSIHQTAGGAPKISILVVPAATDLGGRVFTPAELRELEGGPADGPVRTSPDGPIDGPTDAGAT